ncbi:MAG: hypothetical protein GY711_05845 [bacterium]|nr:hypothetical protein [bacterium]
MDPRFQMIRLPRSLGRLPALLPVVLVSATAAAQDVAGRLLVDLDAADPSAATDTWKNAGELGDFTRDGDPKKVTRDGQPAVAFGGQGGFDGPKTVPDLEEASPRTIEVWAWNPELDGKETLVAWGQRGGPKGTNLTFNFGKDETAGAVSHHEHDLAWSHWPDAKSWCHLAYTYDGERARVFYNGSVMAEREMQIATKADMPIRIAGQNDADGKWGTRATLSIGRVRVHADALTPAQVAANFQREATTYGARPWIELRKARLEDPKLAEKIETAIDRGVAALIAQQELDGSWRHKVQEYGSGMTGLAVYTLLKSGVPHDHPAVQRGLAFIERYPPRRTYALGCALLAVGSLPEGHMDELLTDMAERVIDGQMAGGWAYPENHVDLSNSQYAILGLRAAAARGVRVPQRVWSDAASYAIGLQERRRRDAGLGFSYVAGKGATGSMTSAGVTILAVASQESRRPGKGWEAAIERGVRWLGENFTVTDNPFPGSANGHENSWLHYFQYGLERVGSLLNLDRIGGRDWYAEGAVALVQTQKDEGTWGSQPDTCFGLLFLTRATGRNKPSTGRTVQASSVSGLYGRDDPEAPVSLRAAGRTKLAIWVSSFGSEPLERLAWEGEKKKLRVVRVEYFTLNGDERTPLEARDGDAEHPADDPRFAIQRDFEPGKHRVVADVTVRGPDGEDEKLSSVELEIEVDRAREPELITYATEGADNLLAGVRIETTASSGNGRGAVDGFTATAWSPGKNDAEKSLKLQLKKPVRADTIALAPALPGGAKAADAPGCIKRIELILNGKPREVELDESAWRKTVIQLDKLVAVRTLTIRILEVADGQQPALAEIELRRTTGKRR